MLIYQSLKNQKGEKISMDTKLLKATMILNDDTVEALAKALNLNVTTLYMKMSGKESGSRGLQFTQEEIKLITKRYCLSPDEVVKIFFN